MKRALCCILGLCELSAGSAEYNRRKAGHALVGIAVYGAFYHFGYPKTGVAVAFGLGVGKELYDERHGGRFRCGDVAWTGCPAMVTFSIRWGGKK